jgi:two-component system, OmpR family, sensor histidine kinase KdpD
VKIETGIEAPVRWRDAWPALAVWLAGALLVLAIDWHLVPPYGTFSVEDGRHALLLVALLLLDTAIAALLMALRREARRARGHAARAERLHRWGETLRDADEPLTQAGALQALLAEASGDAVAMLLLRDALPADNDDAQVLRIGTPAADEWTGLWLCLRRGEPLGPGTPHHAAQPDWYLPLRGRGQCLGAAVLRGRGLRADAALREHLQALCDQMGLALQRARSQRDEQRAREQAQSQAVRNALLAAISHDYRTPLATIMGAASSLQAQGARLDAAQRERLAHTIVDEATRLARLTDNTLQLARLDAPGVALHCDWESAEEIVGAVLSHVRRRDAARRVRARLEPALPLLWCDALLLAQLLDNLVDNALKYSPPEAPVELLVQRQGEQLVLAVRDRGPGVVPAWRERIFEVFQRGEPRPLAAAEMPAPGAGAGVGLAVCRAIARAHGGELRLRPRGRGGSSFECVLPLRAPPAPPGEEGAG